MTSATIKVLHISFYTGASQHQEDDLKSTDGGSLLPFIGMYYITALIHCQIRIAKDYIKISLVLADIKHGHIP